MSKFKVGDKVKMKTAVEASHIGQTGEVFEAVENQLLASGEKGTVYSVRLDPWDEEKFADENGKEQVRYRHPVTSDVRAHPADCLGCVLETQIEKIKEKPVTVTPNA